MSEMTWDWDKLRVFHVVCELGSMSRAAARLGEKPSTISRKIDDLERAMNTQLLIRSPKGVVPTAAGQTALRHAASMQAAADAFSLEVANHNDPVQGPITIATGDGLGPYWLAPRLPRLHLAHPKIQLNLNVVEDVPDVVSGEADINIQFSEPRKHDVIARRLGVLHYMFFASQDYLDTYGTPGSIFELFNHRVLFHKGYVEQMERWVPKTADLKRIIDFALVTNSGTVMLNVCAGGGGIAVMPSYMISADPRLVAIDLPEVAPISFWLCYTERVRRLARGKLLIDWIRSAFDPAIIPWFRESFVHPNSLLEAPTGAEITSTTTPHIVRLTTKARSST
jgi:DNA-binding transcriptional LysR family regulator